MVVGGAGFIGSHLTERLLADGHAVDVVDDLSTGSLANLGDARTMGGELKIHTLDALAGEFPSLVALRNPDVLFLLALRFDRRLGAAAAARTMQSVIVALDAARATDSTKVIVAVPAAALYGPVASKDQPVKEGHAVDARRGARRGRPKRRRPLDRVPQRARDGVHAAGARLRVRTAPAHRSGRRICRGDGA